MSKTEFRYHYARFPMLSFLYGFCCDTEENRRIRDAGVNHALNAHHMPKAARDLITSISLKQPSRPDEADATRCMAYLRQELLGDPGTIYRHPKAGAAVLSFLYGLFADAEEAFRIRSNPEQALRRYQLPEGAEEIVRELWFPSGAAPATTGKSIDDLWPYLKSELQHERRPPGRYKQPRSPVLSMLYGLYCDVDEALAIRDSPEEAFVAYELPPAAREVFARVNLKEGGSLREEHLDALRDTLIPELVVVGIPAW